MIITKIRNLAVFVMAAFTIVAGLITTAGTDAGIWSKRADRMITAFVGADNGNAGVFAYAYMADAVARQSSRGWNDPVALGYLRRVLAAQQTDGGWGLTYAWDAFGDGTVNPVSTTYTITTVDHVGPVLLDAYKAGKVSRTVIDTLIAEVMSIPRWTPTTTSGTCVAYSDSPYDAKPSYCVHNVNAAVGLFLTQAKAAGFTVADTMIVNITKRELAAPRTGYIWRYYDAGTRLNDWDHNALNVEAMLTLAPAVGGPALDYMTTHVGDATTPLAHFRLAKFRPDMVNSDFDTYLRSVDKYRLIRYAQLARWTAQAADAAGN